MHNPASSVCVCMCVCVCVCTVRPSLLPPFFVSSSSMYRSIQCQKCPALPYSSPFLLFLPFHNHSVCLEMWQPLWNASSPLTSPPSSLPPFSTTFLSPISSASFLPSIFSSVCYTTIIQPHTRDTLASSHLCAIVQSYNHTPEMRQSVKAYERYVMFVANGTSLSASSFLLHTCGAEVISFCENVFS